MAASVRPAMVGCRLRHGGLVRGTTSPNRSARLRAVPARRALGRTRDGIDRNDTRPLDVEALARDSYMSAGHLSRRFRRAYGESPYRYLMTRRIDRLMALLRPGDLSARRGLFRVGCSSLGAFNTRFTELVMDRPSARPGRRGWPGRWEVRIASAGRTDRDDSPLRGDEVEGAQVRFGPRGRGRGRGRSRARRALADREQGGTDAALPAVRLAGSDLAVAGRRLEAPRATSSPTSPARRATLPT
jgi:AraC-like DNA-binding protein